MKFTVVSLSAVDDALTELWLNSSNPTAVTAAADWIERQLKQNALSKVTAIDNLYFLRRDPLIVLCEIDVAEKLVKIVEVHRADDQAE